MKKYKLIRQREKTVPETKNGPQYGGAFSVDFTKICPCIKGSLAGLKNWKKKLKAQLCPCPYVAWTTNHWCISYKRKAQ